LLFVKKLTLPSKDGHFLRTLAPGKCLVLLFLIPFLSALPETASIAQFALPGEVYEGWGVEGEESTAAESEKKRPYGQDLGSKPSVSSDDGTQIFRNFRKQADSEIKANANFERDNGAPLFEGQGWEAAKAGLTGSKKISY
jgi:hypothetical protein